MLMASTWITIRYTADGSKRYRVMWRFGPRSTHPRYGGSFKTRREAKLRRDWIAGELAANRIPKIGRLS